MQPDELPRCRFCGDRIIGLEAQACQLPAYCLGDDEASRRIDAGGWTGAAHQQCLVRSAAGPDWATVLTRWGTAGSVPQGQAPFAGGEVAWIPGADQYRFVWSDGRQATLRPGELDTAEERAGVRSARMRTLFASTDSEAWEAVAERIRPAVADGILPLGDLMAALGVPAERYDPEVVDSALVTIGRMRDSWRDRVTLGPYKKCKDCVVIHYRVDLPAAAHDAARALAARRLR
ncbi:hypothetical protein [Streptomyces sp. NPDC005408]|uniref:hypothetical protein n=1 Tax=Streptomyces sp. NPDC005408 TaxID=3155341 RepID=UPI0033A04337